MKITPVSNPDSDEKIYRVQDDDSLQGMFFVVIDQEERKLSISSIDLNGDPDEADLLLIAARIPLDKPEEEGEDNDGYYTWGYIDDEDLAKKLVAITGEHAAIITKDLGLSDDLAGDEWAAAMAAGGDNPVSVEEPGMVKASDFEFEFDADEMAGDGDGGGGGGDMDFGSPTAGAADDGGELDPDAEDPEAKPDDDEDEDKDKEKP